jgi:glutathione S-transferase
MSEIVLFEFEGCPFCRKARAALRHKSLPFTRKIVKTSADYLELGRHNPMRQAPVMVYDGEVVRDSTDILYFLEARHPAPALFPKEGRSAAFCHFLEDWADEALSWYGSAFRWVDRRNNQVAQKQLKIAGGRNPFARLFPSLGRLVGRLRVLGQGIGRRPVERLEADLRRHLDRVSDILGEKPFLFGAEISAADIAVWSQLRSLRHCTQEEIARQHPVVGPYLNRVEGAVGDGE